MRNLIKVIVINIIEVDVFFQLNTSHAEAMRQFFPNSQGERARCHASQRV
jgi:hypothetical protein